MNAFEKIKKSLEEKWNDTVVLADEDDYFLGRSSAFMDALSIVSEVEAEYINTSTEHINKSGDCSTNWIPCSERLPENDDDVLVWYQYKMLQGVNVVGRKESHGIGYYYEPTKSWLLHGSFGMDWKVIAWMPLTEPYKTEKGE